MMGRRRVAVFAFGTRGDVLPVAVVVAELARGDPSSRVTFITHEAHRNMEPHLARAGVARFVAVSAPPVVPGRAVTEIAHSTSRDDGGVKAAQEMQLREDCIAAMDSVMGDGGGESTGFVIINLFALEGWHLAELYRVPCAVLAPYVVPYSAPASFERRFRATHPLLYRKLKEAADPGDVGWDEVMHWMWPLFTDRWASWRTDRLQLSACPLTDPVTDLPLTHEWPQASPLLYGFSRQVVECPAYWPRSISVCGFWYSPVEWEMRGADSEWKAGEELGKSSQFNVLEEKLTNYKPPGKVCQFLLDKKFSGVAGDRDMRPIFVGLSSMGSMGFLERPGSMLKVFEAVLEATDSSAILLTAGHPPLDLAITSLCDDRLSIQYLDEDQRRNLLLEGLSCFNGRLFCYSGSVPYLWLLPQCSAAIHHGGSGTTAACLRAAVSQIICPFVLDQFYWAERMTWLGVAPQPLAPQHLMPDISPPPSESFLEAVKVLTDAIKEAFSGELKRSAASLSAKIEVEDGIGAAVRSLRTALCR